MSKPGGHGHGSLIPRVTSASWWLTWLIVGMTFVGLLGGTHPGDALRDRVIGGAASLIAVVNVPLILLIIAKIRRREPMHTTLALALLFLAHVIAASWILWFVKGISHTPPHDSCKPRCAVGMNRVA